MGSICPKQSKGKPDPMKNMGGNNSKVIKNGPPRKVTASKPPVVKALYDFNGMNDGDLAFKMGDRMTILDKSDPDWWKAEKWDDQTTGFIPSNFVVEDNMTVEAQEWWFDMDRRSASVQLKCLTNDLWAFMVRKTEDNKTYAMSILVSRDVNTKNIKHFRIKEESGKYFLTKSITFGDVIRLVEYYKLNPVPGDKYCLGKPCTREEKNVPFRSLEVDRKSIELMEKLGDGMFGKVVKGRFNKTQFVAVKMLKENSLMKKEGLEMEAMIMHRLKHPRIVQLMGICMQNEPYYIVTEYMSNGSLLTFLKSNNEFLEVGQLIDISSQIADGMSYLEKQDPPYIHRDLRAANCLVNENNIAKVADFGLAKMVDEGIYEGGENCKFPVKWTAREGLEAKVFTVKSDVWSFGILLYEIFTLGGTPYPGWDNNLIKTEVLRGYQLKLNHHTRIECPPEVNDYRTRCLSWEPEDRPSFAQLKQFFGSFNTDSYQAI